MKRQPGETSRIWCTSRSRQTYPSPPRGPSSRAQRANRADPPSPRGNGRICPRRCTSTSRATRGCLSWTSPVRSHHHHPPITSAKPARDPRYPPAPTLASPALGLTPQLSTSDFAFRFLDNDPTACADRAPSRSSRAGNEMNNNNRFPSSKLKLDEFFLNWLSSPESQKLVRPDPALQTRSDGNDDQK